MPDRVAHNCPPSTQQVRQEDQSGLDRVFVKQTNKGSLLFGSAIILEKPLLAWAGKELEIPGQGLSLKQGVSHE